MQEFPSNWDLKVQINFLQRKIILNSIVYYECDNNLISDKEYDELCKQLVALHKEYGDISDTEYGYVYYDFDGTTGFDLYHRLTDRDKDRLLGIVYLMTGRRIGVVAN